MDGTPLLLPLADEGQTAIFGSDLAGALRAGDLLALIGDLGAGKTALARAIIRSLRQDPELEVQSPTFSLVQFYEGVPPVSHFDLYRLGDADELEELGLEEAVEEGIAIVEWADRFLSHLPQPAVTVHLQEDGQGGRTAQVSGRPAAMERLARSLEIREFLVRNGWGEAWRAKLAGDASARSYELAFLGREEPRLIMDAPARPDGPPTRHGKPYSQLVHLAEDVEPFVAVADELRRAGFAAPQILAADLSAGILLTEYFGEGHFLDEGRPVAGRYVLAGQLLAGLHAVAWPREMRGPFGARRLLPEYDRTAMLAETELLLDWYLPFMMGRAAPEEDRQSHEAAWNLVLDRLSDDRSIVLRDYHSPNLLWREHRKGFDRLGLIDFQDAVWGPAAYDLASLAMDARVRIPEELEQRVTDAYCALRFSDAHSRESAFLQDVAIMAAQRNAKILGIFVRLDRRDGKPGYLRHLPHIREYMQRALRHPALGEVRELYERWKILEAEPAG